MKRYIFSLWVLLFAVQCIGQDVKMSEGFTMRTDYEYEIIGKVDDKVLLYRNEMSQFTIFSFDKDLKTSKEKKLELGKNYLKFIGITSTPKDFTILFSHRVKGQTYVKAHKYDGKVKLLDSTTIKIYERRAFAPVFSMVKSQNRQIGLLYNVEKEKILETLVFDTKKMKLLWEYNYEPNDFYYRRDFVDFLVGNDGSSHLIIEKDNERSKRSQNRLEFYSYNAGEATETKYMVSFKDTLWYDIDFEYDNMNDRIVAGGFYANDFLTKTIGYFYLNINPKNDNDYILTFHEFDSAFVHDVLGKKKRVNKDGFAEVDIQEIVLRRDGGILLIAERNREYVRQSTTMMTTSNGRNQAGSQVDYYFNDLLVFSIHPTGELHWQDILHKKQYSQDDDAMYSSYFLLKTRSNLRFLYNDEIKQENSVNEYIVNGSGKPDRKNIMNTAGAELMLVMRNALQVSADEVIIPSERRRQLKLVKLTY
ncbi:MAG: hypothetical protein AB8G11_12110 [Saprospiraceae bacterium]